VEEEVVEEEEEEEEEEIATALDSNAVSHKNFDMDACDHSKQGPESEIAPETQNDPEPEAWLGISIFGSNFWDPHQKQNSDSIFLIPDIPVGFSFWNFTVEKSSNRNSDS
jgi:hypothetical protein